MLKIQEEPWKAPVASQVKLSREKKYSNRHASITLLASIPITRFKHTDAALPVCGMLIILLLTHHKIGAQSLTIT